MQDIEKYRQAVDSLIEQIKTKFKDDVISIVVVGSWARGDFIPGQSDIDLNIVIKTGDSSEYEARIRTLANSIQKEYLSGFSNLKEEIIGTSVTTMNDIKSGNSHLGDGFVYYDFLNSSKILFGEDIRTQIISPSKEEVFASAKGCIEGVLDKYNFIEELLEADIESARKHFSDREMAELAFAMFFRGSSVFLATKEIYISNKKQILEEISKGPYPDWMKHRLEMAYNYWINWKEEDLNEEDEFDFLKIAYIYLKSLNSLIAS